MKRFNDLTPEQQTQATSIQLGLLDNELVAQAPSQAQNVAEKKAKRIFYSESNDIVFPISALEPVTS